MKSDGEFLVAKKKIREEKKRNRGSSLLKRSISVISIIGFMVTLYYIYLGYREGIFTSQESLANFIQSLGGFGPVILVLLQTLRTVIKITPAAILHPTGTLILGEARGLFYNSLGSILGSMILFFLSRRYGQRLVTNFIGEDKYQKFAHFLQEGDRFTYTFLVVQAIPLGPADIFCLLAGLSNLSWKQFITILVVVKPMSIFLYTRVLLRLSRFVLPLL